MLRFAARQGIERGPLTAALFEDRTRNPLAFLDDGGEMPFEVAQSVRGTFL
jgi:hypothetical protein